MKSPRVLLTIALAILLTLMLVSIVYAVVCPKCGNENQDNAKFCSECGTPLTSGREPLGQVSLEVVKVKGRRVGGTMAVTKVTLRVTNNSKVFVKYVGPKVEFYGKGEKYLGDCIMIINNLPSGEARIDSCDALEVPYKRVEHIHARVDGLRAKDSKQSDLIGRGEVHWRKSAKKVGSSRSAPKLP